MPFVYVIGAGLIIFLGGCTFSEKGREREQSKIFVYRIKSNPASLDPIFATDANSGAIVSMLHAGLVKLNPRTGEVIPAVTDTYYVLPNGLTWVFILRKNVFFHHGRQVTSSDVKYSFERVMNKQSLARRSWVLEPIRGASEFREGLTAGIEGLKVIDDQRFEITLKAPFTPFLAQLCMEVASIVPQEKVELNPDEFGRRPVGCGPFKFEGWQQDVEIRLQAFSRYYAGAPTIQKLRYLILPDERLALEKFKQGEIDLLGGLPGGQIKRLQEQFTGQLKIWPTLEIRYLGMNLEKHPFKDNLWLRQALNYAIDKKSICEIIYEGIKQPAGNILPPGLVFHQPDFHPYHYDPQEAKRLLAKAGFPEGRDLPELTLWYNSDEIESRVWQFVQHNLNEIGVKVRLKALEWGAFLKSIRAGEAELFRGSWVADFPDAHNFLYVLFHSGNWGEKGNYVYFSSRPVDSLLENAMRSSRFEERKLLYQTAEKTVVEQAPWVLGFYGGEAILIKPHWKGLILPAQGTWKIPLEKLFFEK